MKKFLLIASVLIIAGIVKADNENLLYEYDASGNRITRIVQVNQPRNTPRRDLSTVNITVYPTITCDVVTISTAIDIEQTQLFYTLRNIQGSVLSAARIISQQTQVPLGYYSDGVYLLTVESDSLNESFKIIKRS